jgi:hypothetical protein
MDTDVRQLKLASGEEILCEVVQWQEGDDYEILVRKAMRLIMMENGDGMKYYAFRPWMVYQESSDDLLIINSSHIVGMGFPTDSLMVQWHEAVADMGEMHLVRESEHTEKYGDQQSAVDKMSSRVKSAADKIDDYLERMGGDSASNNVISLDSIRDKTVH